MKRFFSSNNPRTVPVVETSKPVLEKEANDKEAAVSSHDQNSSQHDAEEEVFTSDAQKGVQKIEATTLVWGKKHLIAAYIM